MDYKELDNILSDAVNDAELCCDDIPPISLYLDQIVHLISDKSHEGAERFYNRTLTKTMVNNYSKAGLISPITGKKYSKEQIIQMLMINSLKNTYSISEIKGAMDVFYSIENADSKALMQTYDKYIEMRRKSKVTCPEAVKEMIELNSFDIENDMDYFSAILGVVAMADYYNSIAHAMLEAIAPQHSEGSEAATKESEREIKKGVKAVKKEGKRDAKAQKKAEKSTKQDNSTKTKNAAHPLTDASIEDELSVFEKELDRALEDNRSSEEA